MLLSKFKVWKAPFPLYPLQNLATELLIFHKLYWVFTDKLRNRLTGNPVLMANNYIDLHWIHIDHVIRIGIEQAPIWVCQIVVAEQYAQFGFNLFEIQWFVACMLLLLVQCRIATNITATRWRGWRHLQKVLIGRLTWMAFLVDHKVHWRVARVTRSQRRLTRTGLLRGRESHDISGPYIGRRLCFQAVWICVLHLICIARCNNAFGWYGRRGCRCGRGICWCRYETSKKDIAANIPVQIFA